MIHHHVISSWTVLYSEIRITQVSLSLLVIEASYLYVSVSMKQRVFENLKVEDSNLLGGKKVHNPCTDLLHAGRFPEVRRSQLSGQSAHECHHYPPGNIPGKHFC